MDFCNIKDKSYWDLLKFDDVFNVEYDKFDCADLGETKLIASYMIEDDYDTHAYTELLSHLKTSGVQIYGKGIHGRHNDATCEIVNWFRYQYKKILFEDFNRS